MPQENSKGLTDVDLTNFIDIDRLQLYFGDDIQINEQITLKQPTIGNIVKFGEKRFYSVLSALTCIPSDMKSELWDTSKIDWQTVDDFEFFITMTRNITAEDTVLFFDDLDLSKLKPYTKQDNGQLCLYDPESKVLIDKMIYLRIVTYIREMFNIHPQVEKAKNKKTFQVMIDYDRMKKMNAKKNNTGSSNLLPLISSMLNSPGFKYNKSELRQIGIVEFMDSIQRISVIVSTTALLHGMYSGMMDTSKIKKKDQFNWLRDFSKENNTRQGIMNIKQ